jgi:site-specific DNA-methyltransferase (adenine-specific)
MKLPNKIILKDCIEGLKDIPDNSIDTIIADPPYNIGKDFGNNSDKQKMDDYLNWCKEWISEGYRTLVDGGSMFIYGFSEILAYIFVDIPTDNKKWLIWHYTNKTVPSLKDWQRSHESIIQIWKGGKKNFNLDDVREQYTESFLKNAAGKVRKSTKGRFSNGDNETIYVANDNGALPRDVFKIPALAGGAGSVERWFYCFDCQSSFYPKEKNEHKDHNIFTHPTQKPMGLTRKLYLSSIPKDSQPKVLVLFSGSGSELVVAKTLKFNFLGFELNEDYVKLGNSWLDKTIID